MLTEHTYSQALNFASPEDEAGLRRTNSMDDEVLKPESDDESFMKRRPKGDMHMAAVARGRALLFPPTIREEEVDFMNFTQDDLDTSAGRFFVCQYINGASGTCLILLCIAHLGALYLLFRWKLFSSISIHGDMPLPYRSSLVASFCNLIVILFLPPQRLSCGNLVGDLFALSLKPH
jgi:hypothetical protein